ncbi:MAG: DUF4956 domain-containing protein [Bacteroidetes bacterium]|nr:DUF4956 domain-containing protein [Bacteroidota bacterium]
MLAVPAETAITRPYKPLISVTDETEVAEPKPEKKKDKEKESVEINDRFFISLGVDLAAVLLIILFIYYPNYKKMDTIFTFILFNVVIFVLTFVLNKVKISMGAAFGLFAVFSMLRYRTAGIGVKDMTYLFIFIAIGLISGIELEYSVLGTICGIILTLVFILDRNMIFKREYSKSIQFEKIEMVKPELQKELIAELSARTGLKVHRVVIDKLDYLKDTASIMIYYYE